MKILSYTSEDVFSRNRGLISEEEQQLLADTSIAIAGAGGDGGLLAERLTRFGIGKIILADPEKFEPANLNRQYASNRKNLGRNKAETVAEELLEINPDIELTVYTDGITEDNVNEFVSAADMVVDEIEYSIPSLSVMLHKEARKQNKRTFMGANIGWGASVFCFSPDGMTFEEYFEYNEEQKTINPLKYLREQPRYLTEEQITDVLAGKTPMPALSSSVSLVAAVMTTEIILSITKKRNSQIVPEFLSIDLYNLPSYQ